ncbi:hypothetical protein RA307_29450 [Xanthobacteraceae bacterium Astr-EGSB]|uniref:hypothetical protein n=1 Tax=Astrobacterium formosum TaxID=3069710 RepID=UPI0027B2ACA2|nr:hypothetical protein [Xanthobacteraceae bacterium Astr-EGSB]
MSDEAEQHSRHPFRIPPAPLWVRPDAHLWIRPDADRFMSPGWRDKEPYASLKLYDGRARLPRLQPEKRSQESIFTDAERRLLQAMIEDYRAIAAELRSMREALEDKAGFNPNQPRVPAGNPAGGQWTDGGNGTNPLLNAVRLADAGGVIGSDVMSDASPDPLIAGAQYAMAQIEIHTDALTGIETIDETTKNLTATLAGVVDRVEYVPTMTPGQYGVAVHTAFGLAVRVGNFPGIGFWDVETTFGFVGAKYGSKDSIRTDVVLRNPSGDIIAIYDVKTLGAKLSPSRIRELREKTGTGPNVPIFELQVTRGVRRKMMETAQMKRRSSPSYRLIVQRS